VVLPVKPPTAGGCLLLGLALSVLSIGKFLGGEGVCPLLVFGDF